MNFRPTRAITTLFLAASLALSGCQGRTTVAPTIALETTPAGGDPPEAAAAPAARPTDAAAQPTPAAPGVPAADLEKLKGVEIAFWHPWQGEAAAQAAASVEEFNRKNDWGVRVKVKPFYGVSALQEAVAAAAAAAAAAEGGDLPAVVAAPSEQIAAWDQEKAPEAVDLLPFIADPQIGMSAEETGAFQAGFWAQDLSGERRIAIPAVRGARVLLYNQTWAEDLGFDRPPATPDDFKAQVCAAARENNAARSVELYGTGGWLIDTDPLTMLSWLSAFNAQPVPRQEVQPYRFNSPEGGQALEFLRGMLADGCAWIGRSMDSHEYFALRRALVISGSLTDAYDQPGWQEHAQSEDKWTLLAFPSLDGKPFVFSAGESYAVTANSDAARLAGWLFVRWMAQPATAAKLAEKLPSLPVSQPAAAQLEDYRRNVPWNQILPLMDGVRPAPSLASWLKARRLLEDAAWQVYHQPPENLTDLLPQLDEAVQEMTSGPGDKNP